MSNNQRPNVSFHRKLFGRKKNLTIIVVCIVLLSFSIYFVTATNHVHFYQGLNLSLQENGSNKQVIESNGLTANLSSGLDKTLNYAPH